MGNAAKVGALTLVFAALLVGLVTLLGGRFGRKLDTYFAEFADAGGVAVGAPIRLAGVEVGKVSKVSLKDARTARLEFEIDGGTRIPTDTKAVIPSSLVGFGQTVIVLEPPVTIRGTMPPGSTLQGVKPGPLDGILPDAQGTVAALTDVLKEVQKLLADQGLKQGVSDVLKNLADTLKEVKGITARTDALLAQAQPDLLATLRAGRGTVQNVERVTANVERITGDPQIARDLKALSAQFVVLGKRTEGILASVQKTIDDPQIRRDLKATVREIRALTEKGNAIAANITEVTETGKGIAKNTEKITANVAEITEKSKPLPGKVLELADSAKAISTKIDGILGRFAPRPRRPGDPPAANGGLSFSPTVQVDLLRENQPMRVRGDAALEFPLGQDRLIFGAFDAFDRPGLILQLAKPLGQGRGRLGFYAGKPGLGVDYPLARNLELRADVWDINNPRLDARFRIGVGKGVHGWIGIDRIFAENTFTIGLGFRR